MKVPYYLNHPLFVSQYVTIPLQSPSVTPIITLLPITPSLLTLPPPSTHVCTNARVEPTIASEAFMHN